MTRSTRSETPRWLAFAVAAGSLAVLTGCVPVPVWRPIGPGPIVDQGSGQLANGTLSGMVTDIAIDPTGTADTTLYAATDAGGIWKSTDGGRSWTPKTDGMPALVMGAVALDPANSSVIYAGTGNLVDQGGLPSNAQQSFYASGVYRSTNGGDTWTILNPVFFRPAGDLTGQAITRIVLPDSNTVLVGTQTGLYRMAADGTGVSVPLNGTITDLRLDTGSPSRVYAAIAGSGVYVSSDGGKTFGTAPLFSPASQGLSAGLAFGEIRLAQSTQPDGGTTFYAAAILAAGQPRLFCGGPLPSALLRYPSLGLYRSTDSGRTWSEIQQGPEVVASLQTVLGSLAYDLVLGVDPQDSKTFYYGLRGLYRSTDGGASGIRDNQNPTVNGTPVPCPPQQDNRVDNQKAHADYHALLFSPGTHRAGNTTTTVYLGSDGGLVSTSDGGQTFSYLNGGMGTVLMTGFGAGRDAQPDNGGYSYGSAQDNGLFSRTPDEPTLEWRQGPDSDGITVAVDPRNARHALATNGSAFVTNDGKQWAGAGRGLPGNANPVVYDPGGKNVWAASGQSLSRSTDDGATFALVSTLPQPVQAIAVARSNANIVWIGLLDGTVRVATNALGNAPSFGAPASQPVAQGRVTAVAVDPTDFNAVAVTYAGFSTVNAAVNPAKHVFWTFDGGATWSDVTGSLNGGFSNLPDLPVFSVAIDPGTTPHSLIVAGTGGVFRSPAATSNWERLGTGLPNVEFIGLSLNSGVDPEILRVASWGRSAFELLLPKPRPPCGGAAPNACGGCNTLEVPPGLFCQQGSQCGRYRCAGDSAVICDTSQDIPRNGCGGCNPLLGIPGTEGGVGSFCIYNGIFEGILVCAKGGNMLMCCPLGKAVPGCGPG